MIEPEQPKANIGNRHRNSHRQRRVGVVPWRRDPVIRERVNLHATLWLQGHTEWELLQLTNEWARGHGYEVISESTLYEDRKRALALWQESTAEQTDEVIARHVASLQKVKANAWRDYLKCPITHPNRPRLLEAVANIEVEIGKFDGSYMQKQIDQAGLTLRDLLATVMDGVEDDEGGEVIDMPRLMDATEEG